ncbi:hypothetical protein Tco_0593593, partial [Tanacetum coccineum]
CGVNLINRICLNYTYEDGKPVTFCGCEGPLNREFCSFCASRAGNSFAFDLNPNSFDDSQNLSDYPPQPQYQTYSCELCRNDAHYGYDCPPQVSFNRPAFYEDDDEEYIIAITPVLQTEEPDNSLSMGDEQLSTTPEIESEELIKSSVENLVLISSEFENFSDNESECDFDSLLEEFSGELAHIDLIPPGNNKADLDPEEEIRDRLFLTSDDSMPPGIENDDYDSEGDILFLEELLSNDSPSLPENESFHFDVPSSPRPPAKPSDDGIYFELDTGVFTKVVDDISDNFDN